MIDVEDFKLSVRLSFAPVKPHSCPGTDSESAHRSTQSHLLLGGGAATRGEPWHGHRAGGCRSLKFREVSLLLHGIHHKMCF